jgi:hypothetical protein
MLHDRIEKILEKHGELKTEKLPWLPLYELLGEYIMTRKQHFVSEPIQGEMQNAQVFDSTAINANHLAASALIGAMWPNGAKSVQLVPPDFMKDSETKEVKDFYDNATRVLTQKMDHPKSGFLTALEEYMLDQLCFGISGIEPIEQEGDDHIPIVFKARDCKTICVDEGKNGFVDTVFIEFRLSIRQAVIEYGLETLSKESQKMFLDGQGKTKIKILQAVEPRVDRDPYGFGVSNMPYASIHIEVEQKTVLRESGFADMPVYVTRFWKAMGEKYGRSPGMNALPDILEANALREAMIIANEKTLDPPLVVHDNGALGGGKIDTSAGAINVLSLSGRVGPQGMKPVEPLYTVGELSDSNARSQELREIISNHFFIDRLLDLNNETRMTLGETNIRNDLRGQSLGTVYSRQIAELFIPLVEFVFNVLLMRGLLGVVQGSDEERALLSEGIQPLYIPDAVLALMRGGKNAYDIKFISPAARIMKAEEMQGIQQAVELITPLVGDAPEILDNFNWDNLLDSVIENSGAPRKILNDTVTIQNIRANRAQQQQAMAQLEAAKTQSEIARNAGQTQQMAQSQGQQGMPNAA